MTQIPHDIFRPEAQSTDAARAVLILTADKTEDTEFFYPYYRFLEAGYKVDVVTPEGGEFKGKNGSGLKDTKKITEIDSDLYDLLYIPGGKAPARLKKYPQALELARRFVESNKPVAAICHGPQVLAEAHLIDGRKIAAWPEVEEEIRAAGGQFVNQETVVDGNLITARWPGDLPAHVKKTLEVLEETSPVAGFRPSDATFVQNTRVQ